MSHGELEFESAPEANKSAFFSFWRMTGVGSILLAGVALFLYFTLVVGTLLTGLAAFVIALVGAIYAALRL